jgi:hypothetical protein
MERNNMYKNGIPQFDGQNYDLWSRRMKAYVQAHGFDVWKSIVYIYKEHDVNVLNLHIIDLDGNRHTQLQRK